MRALGYVRVSTSEQADSGLGLEAQRAAIASAAERLELELVHVHADEGVSGTLPALERPGLAALLAAIAAGEVLLVAKRDRLGRDYLEVGLLERELRRRRVRVVSAAGEGTENDEPSALLQRRMMDVFAEHERDMIAARTKAALRAKKARGEHLGGVPFGWRLVEGELVEDLEEQKALALLRRRRAEGASWETLAREVAALGVRPKRGGATWGPSSVRSILASDAKRSGRAS